MKKIKNIVLIILINVMFIPFIVTADSGLDSKYESGGSLVEVGMSTGSSGLSFLAELIKAQPKDKDYASSHIAVSIICILLFYIFTNIYIFKLKKDVKKSKKKNLAILGISLIPTIVFSLLCLLTKLQLILYILIWIIYVVIFKIVVSKKLKKKLKINLDLVKKMDTYFNEEEFGKEAFNIYKEIQLAWMNFELDKIKDLISEEMFNKYQAQLEKLNSNNQQNIMDNIEFKSCKIVDIKIENNIETVECEMKVTCFDYIINDKEKVIKGKKNKKYNYTYSLVFTKNLYDKKYVLVKKQMLKQN